MSKYVLVVDDEPNIVLSLEFVIKKEGYEVRSATDGEEALRLIRERPPDLILLDIMMPKRDGYEVCQEIRADPRYKDVYIIMLTAKGREVDKVKGLSLGADDYITKPFSTREVMQKIRDTFDSG